MNNELESQLSHFLKRISPLLPASEEEIDWNNIAFRWQRRHYLGLAAGQLTPISRVALMDPENIRNTERQKEILFKNTEQFVRGLPCNNVLLTGARGTGKSSLIRAALTRYAPEGLRLIEVNKYDLGDLGEIARIVGSRPERFIVFCDDLSFNMGENGYAELKAVLDGSIAAASDNMLIYATSNLRHLMPERMSDNLDATYDENGDLHPAERVEEQLSLSERFGIWLSFYPFTQDEYLDIAAGWTKHFGCEPLGTEWKLEALKFALQRGSRSGRVAYQFAKDWAGKKALESK